MGGLGRDRDCLLLMLGSLGITTGRDPSRITSMLDQCEVLQTAARGVGDTWAEQHAGLSNIQISLDVTTAKRAKQAEAQYDKLLKPAAVGASEVGRMEVQAVPEGSGEWGRKGPAKSERARA